jgi:hypothetical protein
VTTGFRPVPQKAIVMANVFGRHGWIEELVTRVLKPYHPLDGSSEATGSRTSTVKWQSLSKHAQVVGNRCHINGVQYGYLSDRFFKIAFCFDGSDSLLGTSKLTNLSYLSGKTIKIIRARIMLWEKDVFLNTTEPIVHDDEAESVNMFMASSPCYLEVSVAKIHNDVSSTPYTFRDQLIQEIGQCKFVQATLVSGPFKNFIRSTYLMDQVGSQRLSAINLLYGSVEANSFSSGVESKESLVHGYGCVDTQQSQDESLGDRAAMDGVRNTPSVGDDAEEFAQGDSSVARRKFRNEVDLDVVEHNHGNATTDAAHVDTAVVTCSNPGAIPKNSSNDNSDTGKIVLDKVTRAGEEAFILQVDGERGGVKISSHGDILLYRGLLASNSARVISSKPKTQCMDYLVKLVRVGSTLLKQSDTLQEVGLLMAAACRPLELGFVRLSDEEEAYLENHHAGYRNEAVNTAHTSMGEVAHSSEIDENVSSSEIDESDSSSEASVNDTSDVIDENVSSRKNDERVSSSEASVNDTSDEDYVPSGETHCENYTTVTATFRTIMLGLEIGLCPISTTRPSNVVILGFHRNLSRSCHSQRSKLSKGDYLVGVNDKPLTDFFSENLRSINPVVDLLSRAGRPLKLVFRRYEGQEAVRKTNEEKLREQRLPWHPVDLNPCPAPRGLANDKDVVADRPRKLRKLKPKDVFLENDEVSVEDEEVRATSEESSVDLTKKTFLEIDEIPAVCEEQCVENKIVNNAPTSPSVAASLEQEEEETMVVESSSEYSSPARNSEKDGQQEHRGKEFSNGHGLRRPQTKSFETQDALVSLMEEESDNGISHITRYEQNIASPHPQLTFLRTQAKLEADFDSEMKKIPEDDVRRRETIKRRFVRLKHTLSQEAPNGILRIAEEITEQVSKVPSPKRLSKSNQRDIRKFLQVLVDKYYKGQRLSLDMLQVSVQNHFGFDLSAQRRFIEEIYLDLEKEKKRLQEKASLLEAHHNDCGKFRYIACAGALWRTNNNASTFKGLSDYGGERVEAEECPVLPEKSLAVTEDTTSPPSKRAINFPGETSNLIHGVPKKIKLEGVPQPKISYIDI